MVWDWSTKDSIIFGWFLQYISPTISLILGVVMYGESFTKDHVVTFACIWIAIAIFTVSNIRQVIKKRKMSKVA